MKIVKWINLRKVHIPVYENQSEKDAYKNKFKIYKTSGKKVGIQIDGITDCLKERKTGKIVNTTIERMIITNKMSRELNKKGWLFKWHMEKDCEIYAIKVEGSDEIEGLVALDIKEGYVEVRLVESNPHNRLKPKKYIGVGAHLFAIGCKISFDCGFEGFICFDSKTNLISYYEKKLGAQRIGSTRMSVDEKNAKILVDKYMKGVNKYANY